MEPLYNTPNKVYNLRDIYFMSNHAIFEPETAFYKQKKYFYTFTKQFRDKLQKVQIIETKDVFNKYCRLFFIKKKLLVKTLNGEDYKTQCIVLCFTYDKEDNKHLIQNSFIKLLNKQYFNEVRYQKDLFKVQTMETFRNKPVIYYSSYMLNHDSPNKNKLLPKFLNVNEYGVTYNDADVYNKYLY